MDHEDSAAEPAVKRARVFLIENDDEDEDEDKDVNPLLREACHRIQALLYNRLCGNKADVGELSRLQYDTTFAYGGGFGCEVREGFDYVIEMAQRAYRSYFCECLKSRKAAALCLLRLMRIRDLRKLLFTYVMRAEALELKTMDMLDFCSRNFIGRYHRELFWKDTRVRVLLEMAKKNV
jgi:hypothetical protein